jgi:RNA polymerase sigma factor (sigma-70 family)
MKPASLQRVTAQLRQLASRGAGNSQTDRQLLDRFLALGEEAAFAELVRRHGPMVLTVCRRVLHHQQDAEDAFQAAFLVLARKAGAVRHAESVAGWLYQVAFRLALRARNRTGRHKEQLTAMCEPLAATEDRNQRDDMQSALGEAVQQLPDHYRSAVVLCYLESKTQSDAARQLGTTAEAINSRLKRARQLLRLHLKRRGLLLTTGAVAALLAGQRAAAAGLPADLLGRTSRAAIDFTVDSAGANGATPAAVALAQGALRTMWTNSLKVLSGLLLVVALLVAAAWLPAVVFGDDPLPPTAAPIAAPLPAQAPQPRDAGRGKNRPGKMHCIILWMNGGPSQIDTFDPKPGDPNGGPFKAIETNVKGVQISEHLPKLAGLADHLAIIRSLKTGEGDHMRGAYLMHTGYAHDGRTDYPTLGCILGKELGDDTSDLPRFVIVSPKFPGNFEGNGPGYLGPKYTPLVVEAPGAGFRPNPKQEEEQLRPPPKEAFAAVDPDRAEKMRRAVLKAFDLESEKRALQAYGTNGFGQGCLLARRLVELGVPVVEVTMPGWDTHQDNFDAVAKLSKTLDAAWSALISDLKARKLLDSTLIVWMGEFGRTPRITGNNGRDHWPSGFSVVLAGGRIKGGQVVGKTSADATKVVERPVTLPEFYATIYQAVGVDPTRQYQANTGAPVRLVPSGNKAIAEILK